MAGNKDLYLEKILKSDEFYEDLLLFNSNLSENAESNTPDLTKNVNIILNNCTNAKEETNRPWKHFIVDTAHISSADVIEAEEEYQAITVTDMSYHIATEIEEQIPRYKEEKDKKKRTKKLIEKCCK